MASNNNNNNNNNNNTIEEIGVIAIKRKRKFNIRVTVDFNLLTIFLLASSSCFPILFVNGQSSFSTRDPRFYSREGDFNYQWPNPGDPNYRTYTFNDRRYGYYQPSGYGSLYPGQKQPGQYPEDTPLGEEKFRFDPNNPQNVQTPFPGILGGWREDLQGKQRRDSLFLDDRDVFVTTNHGQVQGFKVRLFDNPDPKSFYRPHHNAVDKVYGVCSVFLGIPYALPPTFEGRFKPPRVHRGWQLLQAVDYGPACPQPVRYTGATKGIRDMDEDCLYLNVFSPNTAAGVAQKYPVMMYIHGGEFHRGASNSFQGHMLAAFYDVVVVTINYRLGALGFLSTGDDNSPGNYGILDQAMALRWVYDNAEFFNGDRNLITLFGEGAGAASAGLLMVAPQTRNLVTRVIAQSGSATADWALIVDKYRAQNTSRVYGRLLGCSIESSWNLVNCLRQGRSFYELGNAEFAPDVGFFPWGPVLENNFTFPGDNWYEGWHERDWRFLHETPTDLIRRGQFNRGLHYMTGVTMQEAAYIISQNDSLGPYYEVDERFYNQKVRELVLRFNYTLNPNGVYEAIKYMYTYWPSPQNTTHIRDQYIHLLSDFIYRAPVDNIVKLLLQQNVPVYMYVMNTTVEGLKLPEWRKVPHNSEHYFLTGAPFMDIEFFPRRPRLDRNMWTDNDRNMSHFFMKTFSDFARFGNPTPQQVLGLHFDKAIDGELKYLNLNTTFNTSILLNYRQTETAFWTQYLPSVIGILVPTYPPFTEFWWEPREPLQIAFWSMAATSMFLMVIVVICCILWRNAKRQADRFYDGDIFLDPNDDRGDHLGIENNIVQSQPLKSREHIYDYRGGGGDNNHNHNGTLTKSEKSSLPDGTSIRSPSSLAMTQTTKNGSQNSLRSAISLKDSTIVSTNPGAASSTISAAKPLKDNDKTQKYSERLVDTNPKGTSNTNGNGPGSKYDDSRNLINVIENKSVTQPQQQQQQQQPVPSARNVINKPQIKTTSKTHLIEGIPQTEV